MDKKVITTDCGNVTVLAGDTIDNVIEVTEAAKQKIEEVCSEQEPGTFLRVAVGGGGCSGFQYMFGFDTDIEDTDIINDWGSGKVVIDEMSIQFLKGATVDFVCEFDGEYFSVHNPYASSQCGCGSSFDYDMDGDPWL